MGKKWVYWNIVPISKLNHICFWDFSKMQLFLTKCLSTILEPSSEMKGRFLLSKQDSILLRFSVFFFAYCHLAFRSPWRVKKVCSFFHFFPHHILFANLMLQLLNNLSPECFWGCVHTTDLSAVSPQESFTAMRGDT